MEDSWHPTLEEPVKPESLTMTATCIPEMKKTAEASVEVTLVLTMAEHEKIGYFYFYYC